MNPGSSQSIVNRLHGALLINKHVGTSSFGIIKNLQEILRQDLLEGEKLKRKELPKLGHGGTLDPFATGLLVVLVGRAVKLARYFLGATKFYEGQIKFGETTLSGDPTSPVSKTSAVIPPSLQLLQDLADRMTSQPYSQIPPMHSAKKQNGKPLYELARQGIEVDREPRLCHIYDFKIHQYQAPVAQFSLSCSSGTYVRTLTQDFAKDLNTVAVLETLNRRGSGIFKLENAMSIDQISRETQTGKTWDELPCWVPFHQLLAGYDRAEATLAERNEIIQGKQRSLPSIIQRIQAPAQRSSMKQDCVAIYCQDLLFAIARKAETSSALPGMEEWGIERVFVS